MSQHQNCPCKEECALQAALESIGGKWKMRILCSLSANGASRYNELLHNVKGISNTMLSQTLREMEQDQLIIRKEYLEEGREEGRMNRDIELANRMHDRGMDTTVIADLLGLTEEQVETYLAQKAEQ